jgi:hypothetical protein
MSSSQKQQQEHVNIRPGLSVSNSQVVQTAVAVDKHTSLVEAFDRRESSSNTLSPAIDYQAQRRSSAPAIIKLVGSNKYFTCFLFYLPCFICFYIDYSSQLKSDHSIHDELNISRTEIYS